MSAEMYETGTGQVLRVHPAFGKAEKEAALRQLDSTVSEYEEYF